VLWPKGGTPLLVCETLRAMHQNDSPGR